jgi:hypothetical protein
MGITYTIIKLASLLFSGGESGPLTGHGLLVAGVARQLKF